MEGYLRFLVPDLSATPASSLKLMPFSASSESNNTLIKHRNQFFREIFFSRKKNKRLQDTISPQKSARGIGRLQPPTERPPWHMLYRGLPDVAHSKVYHHHNKPKFSSAWLLFDVPFPLVRPRHSNRTHFFRVRRSLARHDNPIRRLGCAAFR